MGKNNKAVAGRRTGGVLHIVKANLEETSRILILGVVRIIKRTRLGRATGRRCRTIEGVGAPGHTEKGSTTRVVNLDDILVGG